MGTDAGKCQGESIMHNTHQTMSKLIKDYAASRLESCREAHPEEWIQRLEIISNEMKNIDNKCKRQEEELIAHVFRCLSSTVPRERRSNAWNRHQLMKKSRKTFT
jgi:hypothetical protein